LYVASATEYFEDEKTVAYSCVGNTIGKKQIDGCGHQGEIKIKNGEGKLAWKVEFAARWQAFDIRFEAFGKDIMDSVRINDWVASEILGFHHPLHIKYEMFLDKGGKKISKSAGNVLTPQMWFQYGTPESLLLLLYKRITGTRHIGIDDIPILMDEYDLYEDIYFDKIKEKNTNKAKKIKGIYEYVNNLNPSNVLPIHIPYRILIQQSELFIDQKVDSPVEKIYERLKKYGLIKEETTEITKKIQLSMEWAKEFKDDDDLQDKSKITLQLEDKQKKAIGEVLIQLKIIAKNQENSTIHINPEEQSQQIQTLIFLKSKENNIEPKEFFKLFYKILINTERGPKLGNYIVDLGMRSVINKIEKIISGF
jgi:lysyl-tRNA synthetase class 1